MMCVLRAIISSNAKSQYFSFTTSFLISISSKDIMGKPFQITKNRNRVKSLYKSVHKGKGDLVVKTFANDKGDPDVETTYSERIAPEIPPDVIARSSGSTFSALKNILNFIDVVEVTAQQKSKLLLSSIIVIGVEDFYKSHWGRLPLYSESPDPTRFQKIVCKKYVVKLVQDHANVYNTDFVFLKYGDGGYNSYELSSSQIPPFLDGQDVSASQIWDRYNNSGAILKLLCPQKYNDSIWKMLSVLEHEFGTSVLSEVLLVPGGVVNHIPARYSLSDNWILQSEGTSVAKIYRPLTAEQIEKSLVHGQESELVPAFLLETPYMTVTLSPGDCLYCPFGWAVSQDFTGISCVQLTIITNTHNSLGNILDLIVPQAVALVNSSAAAQRPLPRNFFEIMGVARAEDDDDEDGVENSAEVGAVDSRNKGERDRFLASMKSLMQRTLNQSMEMIDAASDQHVKSFILQRLPVPLHETEEKRSAAGTPEAKIFPFTVLRMIRPGVARAVVEDGMIIVYHCMDNARLQEETVVSPIEFDIDDGPAIEALLSAYPRGVEVSDLPHPSEELDDKVSVAAALYKEGFLYIEDEGTLPFEREIGDSENSDDPF